MFFITNYFIIFIEIKINKTKNMIKVLFLHGMGGTGISSHHVHEFFRKFEIELISPTVNYQLYINNPHIFNTLKELGDEADMIVGNSMGGYFSYHLSKACGKPSLNFNPAISEVTTSYNWFNQVTDYELHEDQKKKLIYMSTKDYVVDHKEGLNFLKNENLETNVVERLVGETHSLSFPLMLQKIVKFKQEVFREDNDEEFELI